MRLLWKTSRPLFAATVLLILANAAFANSMIVFAGKAVGKLPAATVTGLGSGVGRSLVVNLALAGVFFTGTLLTGTYQDWLSLLVRNRLTDSLEERLLTRVSGPPGIAHLEDPTVLTQLEQAQGNLTSLYPADAPVTRRMPYLVSHVVPFGGSSEPPGAGSSWS